MSALNYVRPLASFARFVASACVLTTAVRIAIVAWQNAGTADAGATAPSSSAASPSSSSPVQIGRSGRVISTAGPPPGGKPGQVQVRLSVDVSPERADVYVDGVKRGQVPFLGDVTCVEGKRFTVEVVAKTGVRQKFERTCTAGVMRIQ